MGALFLAILLVGGVLAVTYLIKRHRTHAAFLSAHDKSLVHVQWHAVEQHLKKGGATHLRQAVVDGDKLVDYVMKQLNIPGDTMGERLRSGRHRFTDYEGLWQAHKLRNQIVHEMDREVLSFEAKQMVGKFRTALHDLGAV